MKTSFIGKYCIIRSDRAGVFAGTVAEHEGQSVILKDVRRLWYWDGAASDFQISVDGSTAPENCKFTMPVETLALFDVIEILPATDKARSVIEGIKIWKR
ncbi:MAG: hypothetical protein NC299_11855 [Lachnospiraceae bacterium]|nr:hypothetical protein [Lachnospiraceae bacterium]